MSASPPCRDPFQFIYLRHRRSDVRPSKDGPLFTMFAFHGLIVSRIPVLDFAIATVILSFIRAQIGVSLSYRV